MMAGTDRPPPRTPTEPTLTEVAIWSLFVGGVLTLAALGRGPLKRTPISMPAIYLAAGVAIGPWGLGLVDFSLTDDSKILEVLSEIAVLISLLTAGLRLKPDWELFKRAPLPLASVGMVVTIFGITAIGYFALGLPIGAAILLGAVLAPTDPVLASEVQVQHEDDRNRLRYSLTGEAGLNDGAAFPFIMLGLGLLGHHELGRFGWRWLAVDLVWATAAGLVIGWAVGYVVSRVAVWARRRAERIGDDSDEAAEEELFTLGLIGLSYGVAMACHSYGFLAVFAAGVAMRVYAENDRDDGEEGGHADETLSLVAEVNEQFERIAEVALVVVIGAALANHWTLPTDWWIALVLFAVIRPVASTLSLWPSDADATQRGLIAFFGIRGIGSIYYLAYAIEHGVEPEIGGRLAGVVVTTIVLSLAVHSNIASLLLRRYAG